MRCSWVVAPRAKPSPMGELIQTGNIEAGLQNRRGISDRTPTSTAAIVVRGMALQRLCDGGKRAGPRTGSVTFIAGCCYLASQSTGRQLESLQEKKAPASCGNALLKAGKMKKLWCRSVRSTAKPNCRRIGVRAPGRPEPLSGGDSLSASNCATLARFSR
jgi:hypothetical protein